MLGRARPALLGDGAVHLAKVAYYPELKAEFLEYFTASDGLLPFVQVGQPTNLIEMEGLLVSWNDLTLCRCCCCCCIMGFAGPWGT